MKRLSVILASLVLFAGVTFAQQTGTMSSNNGGGTSNKGMKTQKGGSTTGSSTSSTGGTATPVKKVPASKGKAGAAQPAPQKASK